MDAAGTVCSWGIASGRIYGTYSTMTALVGNENCQLASCREKRLM